MIPTMMDLGGKYSKWSQQQKKTADDVPLRKSIPRQVDKKSSVPEEEKGIWGSQGGRKDTFFLHSLVRII